MNGYQRYWAQKPLKERCPNWDRDEEIIRLREMGETLKAIGDRFGINKERVRQIIIIQHARRKKYADRLADIALASLK